MTTLQTTVLALSLMALGTPALAQCTISGEITAAPNADHPDLGQWAYTLAVTWDTGSQTALSHLDFVMDLPGGTCMCSDFSSALAFADIAGNSTGTGDCTVEYQAFLECNGDPSIPIEGILIKWEPLANDPGCEPDATGTGWFTFYSDLAPVAMDGTLPLLVEKNDGESCSGTIDGVFPGLLCNPVTTTPTSWSAVKGFYRD